jgi:hypothetical protein
MVNTNAAIIGRPNFPCWWQPTVGWIRGYGTHGRGGGSTVFLNESLLLMYSGAFLSTLLSQSPGASWKAVKPNSRVRADSDFVLRGYTTGLWKTTSRRLSFPLVFIHPSCSVFLQFIWIWTQHEKSLFPQNHPNAHPFLSLPFSSRNSLWIFWSWVIQSIEVLDFLTEERDWGGVSAKVATHF